MFQKILTKTVLPAYLLLVGVPLAALILVLKAGSHLSAPIAEAVRTVSARTVPAPVSLFLLVTQIAVIILVSRIFGILFKKIHQPQVVGEMLSGILLGPSLLGWVAPSVSAAIFPAASLGYLSAISQIGLVFFMFLIGIELNPDELRRHSQVALVTSHASIAFPFFLGSALALYMYPRLGTAGVKFSNYALFIGSAMSITAFPVLARILSERKLLRSPMGTLSISCAIVDDLTGWCILAYIVVLVRSESSTKPMWMIAVGAIVFFAAMIFAVRPALMGFERSFRKYGRVTDNALSGMLVLCLISAVCTEWLGIQALFGAFFLGAAMPKDPGFVKAVQEKLESLTVVALLPLFFAFSGLRTSVASLRGDLWLDTLLVIGVAVAGKFGGSMLAARLAGVSWRYSAALGALMNTRGLMGMVVLNIGLDIGVISETVFTIMMLMALATTFMTTPLLELIYPSRLSLQEEKISSAA
jgi:Kef-type K+ transport system membrane component KefB